MPKRLLLLGVLLCAPVTAAEPPAEFTVARLHYDGGGDWYSNPSSLPNLLAYLAEAAGVSAADREVTVRPLDDDLFLYPFLYLTGHGNISFSHAERERLRRYLDGGGFLHADDNYGLDPYLRRELAALYPEEELVELPFDHPIYHCYYDFHDGLPKVHEHDGKPPQGLGIFRDGRLVIFYTYECDLGDGWEDPAVHGDPPEIREAALRMGVNIILYALSH